MKRVIISLMFACAFAIYGCSNEGVPETEPVKNEAEVNEPISETPDSKEPGSDMGDWRSQYNQVLVELLNTFGPAYNGPVFYGNAEWNMGVVYAELIDFDQDGKNELYVLFESEEFYDLTYEHRNASSFIQEVWQATDSGEAKLLHAGEILKDNCLNCGTGFSFLEQSDGRIVILEASEDYSFDDGDSALFTNSYYTLEKGVFEEETLEFYTGNDEYVKINRAEVSDEAYSDAVAKYDLPERKVVENEYGIYSFNVDFESSAAYLGNFLRDLNADVNTLASKGKKAEADVVSALEGKALRYIEIDVNNPSRFTEMLGHMMENYYLEMEYGDSSFDEYLGYSEVKVAEKFEAVYGIPLAMEHIDTSEDGELTNYRMRYQDGEFSYMPVEDLYPVVMRRVENAYEIAPNTYYLELLDVEFDEWMFWIDMEGYQEDPMDYVLKPFDEWPHEMRTFGKTDIHRYAVVKLVNGEVVYHYLSFDPLSDDEMKQY